MTKPCMFASFVGLLEEIPKLNESVRSLVSQRLLHIESGIVGEQPKGLKLEGSYSGQKQKRKSTSNSRDRVFVGSRGWPLNYTLKFYPAVNSASPK